MTDLVARLREAIDETEQVAQAAGGVAWVGGEGAATGSGYVEEEATGEVVVYDEGRPSLAQAVHIARQNPKVTLRRCAADRKILDLHGPGVKKRHNMPDEHRCVACLTNRYGYSDNWEPDQWPCPTVLVLAEFYEIES